MNNSQLHEIALSLIDDSLQNRKYNVLKPLDLMINSKDEVSILDDDLINYYRTEIWRSNMTNQEKIQSLKSIDLNIKLGLYLKT